jgi:predicted nucleic acid-binding protein
MTVLIDSDILIEVSRGRDTDVLQRWTGLSESEHIVLCSPVSVAELWQGALPKEHAALKNLFATLVCIPIVVGTARQAAEYLRRYRKSHHVELADALIAASAAEHSAALWTRNRKHYPMRELSFF